MPSPYTRLCRWATIALAGALLQSVASAAQPTVDLLSYAEPGTLVDIGGGRHLNLRCTGAGSPTILLEAGLGMTSRTWATVQPMLARTNKVCAYDRAGFGFSEGGPVPRDLAAEAADLRALVVAAPIETPLVLVAHSWGTAIARAYARDHRSDLAGIVLLDPSPMNLAAVAPQSVKENAQAIGQVSAFAVQCGSAARKGRLPATTAPLASCIAPDDPHLPAALSASIRRYKLHVGFWDATSGELMGDLELSRQALPAGTPLGDTPLIVLTADGTFALQPAHERKVLEEARTSTHAAIVATSTRGERRLVSKSSHFIQQDQPTAVVGAVGDVIRISHRKGG
ncbi:MAG: alpha/beta hydrolase [Dokdonella sp.]|uniref:alpha/beta fold hydrolase n=1 Tax=Dokdonella sp. TaxID=2291710 RepID=UPI0032631B30